MSTTTRLPRQGEQDGVDYHFVSREDFEELERNNALIESVEYDGNRYGISSAEAERAFGLNKPAVLVAEPHGVAQIHDYCTGLGWNVLRVFVNNPLDTLVARILQRFHTDTAHLQPDRSEDSRLFQRKLGVYADRVIKLVGFEQEHWVKPAFDGQTPYELLVDRFDAPNQQDVIDQVLSAVASYQDHNPTRRRKP